MLRNPLSPGWRHYPEVLNDAARALGLELVGADARGPEEVEAAFAAMAAAGVDALFVLNDPLFVNARPMLLGSASGAPIWADRRREASPVVIAGCAAVTDLHA